MINMQFNVQSNYTESINPGIPGDSNLELAFEENQMFASLRNLFSLWNLTK